MRGLKIDAGFLLLIALMMLLLDPLVSLSVLIASAVHECGHLLAIRFFGGRIKRLQLGLYGAQVSYDGWSISYVKEAVCAIAGPLVNIALALLLSAAGRAFELSWLYLPAGTCLIIGAFNLLPARVLDGGRAIYMLVCGKRGLESAEKLATILNCATAFVVLCLGAYVAYTTRRNFSMLIIGVWLLCGERRLTKRLR